MPKLTGDQLSEALKPHPWDESVKSLVSFPQVLAMMSEKLDWTQKLGDAFLAQQQDVMAAVQRLRVKAHTAGNLKTTAEQKVTVAPAEAPAPPSAAATPAQTVVVQPAPLAVAVGASLWGNCNWNSGHADVNINQYNNYTRNVNTSTTANQRNPVRRLDRAGRTPGGMEAQRRAAGRRALS